MNMRPSKDDVLMSTAELWATRSTCSRLSVGAVIHSAGRILVQGYNGAPSGLSHCDHRCNCWGESPEPGEHDPWCNSLQPCERATHAEQNGISWAAKLGIMLLGSDLVVTHQPCINCARLIVNCGIKSVTYKNEYRLKDGLELLHEAGLEVTRFVDQTESRLVD